MQAYVHDLGPGHRRVGCGAGFNVHHRGLVRHRVKTDSFSDMHSLRASELALACECGLLRESNQTVDNASHLEFH